MTSSMTIEKMKALAATLSARDKEFVDRASAGFRYVKSENDILKANKIYDATGFRKADNRVPAYFLGIMITSKCSYLVDIPPTFDVGNENMNKIVANTLGEKWHNVCYELCYLASVTGRSYIHYWIDENNNFQYAPVNPLYIMPIKSNDLISNLEGVIYQHSVLDMESGDLKEQIEYWDDTSAFFYITGKKGDYEGLEEYYPWVNYKKPIPDVTNEMRHGMEAVPFIECANNYFQRSDLEPVKYLIDAYDKVLSGYVNDLEDIQQILMVLRGYEGEDLDDFRNNLLRYKAITLDSDDEVQGSLEIKQIEIPYQAREALLKLLRNRIFEDGQGIDPDPQNFGNSSGTALKHLYDNLELKSSQTESYFRPAFEQLVRAICKHNNFTPERVHQTWIRNVPSDDTETAEMARSLDGIISRRSQIALLSFIENPEAELEQIKKETEEESIYLNAFTQNQLDEGNTDAN